MSEISPTPEPVEPDESDAARHVEAFLSEQDILSAPEHSPEVGLDRPVGAGKLRMGVGRGGAAAYLA